MYMYMYVKLAFLVTLIGLVAGYSSGKRSYSGYHVLKTYAADRGDLELLKGLRNIREVNFWNPPVRTKSNVTFSVGPDVIRHVRQQLNRRGLPVITKTTDLQRWIDDEHEENMRQSRASKDSHLTSYLRHQEINEWLSKIIFKCHPSVLCETKTIGYSYKGRPIDIIEIGGAKKSFGRSAIWIDAGLHAREWIAPSTALFIIDRLINDYKKDELTRSLVDSFTWYILPVANPDGYEYTFDSDRLWRKNRSPTSKPSCVGVDLNRNFDFHWSDRTDGNDPCADTYGGPKPLSEVESLAVADFLNDKKKYIKGYMSLHAYGQLWLMPWAYTKTTKPEDYKELMRVAQIGKQAIKDTHNKNYRVGTVPDLLYESHGSSMDWAKAVMGIKYSYVIELRDEDGFVLPTRDILPTGEEAWAGIKAMAVELKKKEDF